MSKCSYVVVRDDLTVGAFSVLLNGPYENNSRVQVVPMFTRSTASRQADLPASVCQSFTQGGSGNFSSHRFIQNDCESC